MQDIVQNALIGVLSLIGVIYAARSTFTASARATEAQQETARETAVIQKETAQGPNWAAYADRVETRLAGLEEKVPQLEARAEKSERVQVSAIAYVIRLLDWIADQMPGADHPRIPDDLREHIARAGGTGTHLPRP